MKKTTLSKLVKLALYEAYKEERGGILKGSDTNLEKITPLERAQLNESLGKREAKILKEQNSVDQENLIKLELENIYNFLVTNSKAHVPLEDIADNPLLININIDGISVIYNTISTLTLEEFIDLSSEFYTSPPPMLVTCTVADDGCGEDGQGGWVDCPNYGLMNVYETDCTSQSISINDFFVCCSKLVLISIGSNSIMCYLHPGK